MAAEVIRAQLLCNRKALLLEKLSGVQVRAQEEQLQILMIETLAGNAGAYRSLLSTLAPLLRTYYGRRLRHAADDIEDLVQEALIAIHTRRATYDPTRSFVAWAFAVARYKMIDHLRRTRFHVPIDELEDILLKESFEAEALAGIDVERLLAGLPPKQARVIRDTKIDGLSVAESAAHNGLTDSDVKVSVHRGLKALSARIRDK